MSNSPELMEVRLKSMTFEAENIISLELHPLPGYDLKPFTAGGHIDLHLSNGLIRSYSLVNSQSESHRYVVAVSKDRASRGGSRFVHETLKVGDKLTISGPRNNFPLNENADHSVLIAGGIGITPILSMATRLQELGRSWELYYAARTRQSAAFLDRLRELQPNVHIDLHVNFDQEPGGRMLDLKSIVEQEPAQAHLYCCGPLPMLEAFEQATSSRPPDHVHVEYFKAKEGPAVEGGFSVTLNRSARTVDVKPGQTILDALLDAGVEVSYSCVEGYCGTCATTVLQGEPDHRDLFLSKEEKAANRTMMICCSGAKTKSLVLDM